MELNLNCLKTALVGISDSVYHYTAPPNHAVPYIIWAEDRGVDLIADNRHVEAGTEGTIDLFTRNEHDPLISAVPEALNGLACGWYLNSVQYEEDTGLIHCEWVWRLYG